MTLGSPSLRLQLVLSVLGMTLFAALMFGFLTLLFAHSVEDSLFEQELIRQGKAVQQNWVETGRLSETSSDYISTGGNMYVFVLLMGAQAVSIDRVAVTYDGTPASGWGSSLAPTRCITISSCATCADRSSPMDGRTNTNQLA